MRKELNSIGINKRVQSVQWQKEHFFFLEELCTLSFSLVPSSFLK